MRALLALSLLLVCHPALARVERPTVAVLYFDNNTGDPALDVLKKGLADMMVTDLSQVESLTVVERDKLQALLKELKLQRGRYFDKRTAVRLGKGLGARYAVTGAIAAVSPQLRLDVRLIDVKTSKIIVSDKVVGQKDSFFELQTRLVNRFVQGLNLKFSFKPKIGLRVPDLKSLLQYSQGVDLADQGRLEEAEQTMKALVQSAPTFGLARQKREDLAKALAGAQQRRVEVKGQSGDELQRRAEAYLESKKVGELSAEEAGVYLAYRTMRGRFLLRALDLSIPGGRRVRALSKGRLGKARDLIKAYIKNTDLLIEERDSLLLRLKNIRAELGAEDQALAKAIDFKTSVDHEITSAELVLGSFILLGEARYGDSKSFVVAPAPAELLGGGLKKTGFALLERAEARFAARKLEHMVLNTIDAGAEAELLRGQTEAAVKRWQRFLNAYPTSSAFPRVEEKVQIALGMKSNNDSRELAAFEAALSGCDDMDIRKGGQAMIERRVRTEGLGAVDAVINQLIKTCKGRREARSAWTYLLDMGADYGAAHGDCALYERYKRAQLEAGASARSEAKLHARNKVSCKNIAEAWAPEPVCWSIDVDKSKLPFSTLRQGLEDAGERTQPIKAWYTKDQWFKLVHPSQRKEKSEGCRALVYVHAEGDREKATLTLNLERGPKAPPFKVRYDKEKADKALDKAWRDYVWKRLLR